MNCLILAIGNELLNGEIVDTNSSFLQHELSFFSLHVKKVSILPDDVACIQAEIQKGFEDYPYIFITGGLGPTEDDLTRDAVAKALGKKLIQNKREMKILKKKFETFGRKMSPNNEKQAFFPENAEILPNPLGTAPGFSITEKGRRLFILPGVPSEMKNVFHGAVIPVLVQELSQTKKPEKLTVKTMGKGESTLDSMIKKNIIPLHSVRWEIIAKGEGVFIKFYPLVNQEDDVWKKGLMESLETHMGSIIYGYDCDEMGDVIARLLVEKGLTLGCVESCTGGYVSKYLTDWAGSSHYFIGGLVTYSDDSKHRLAGVDPELLVRYGAVSEEVAGAMARGGKNVLGSDICLSISGIAGPAGGSDEKPVGTVWLGVLDHKGRLTTQKRIFTGEREDVRKKSLFYGLNLVRLVLYS